MSAASQGKKPPTGPDSLPFVLQVERGRDPPGALVHHVAKDRHVGRSTKVNQGEYRVFGVIDSSIPETCVRSRAL